MRALLILYLTHQLGFDITMPSACSAHMLLWFTLPLFRRLACRPPARQPHCSDCRRVLMTLGHVVLGIDTNSTFSLIWRWQSLFVATVYSNQTSAVAWRALRRERSST